MPELFTAADPRSIDRARRDDPLVRLRRDAGDALEVGVVVQHDQTFRLGCRGDEQVGNLSTPLTPPREQLLHLTRPFDVACFGLDECEHTERFRQPAPLVAVARRVPDLEVADAGSGERPGLRERLACYSSITNGSIRV